MSIAVTVRRHVDNENLDELVDQYLFHHGRWCYGESKQVHHSFDYRCQICGLLDENTSYARSVFGGPHPRLVPQYSIEDILKAMMGKDHSTQVVFGLAVRALCKAACPQESSEWLALLAAMTPRLLEIAALQALGVVDSQGFLKGSQDREEGRCELQNP